MHDGGMLALSPSLLQGARAPFMPPLRSAELGMMAEQLEALRERVARALVSAWEQAGKDWLANRALREPFDPNRVGVPENWMADAALAALVPDGHVMVVLSEEERHHALSRMTHDPRANECERCQSIIAKLRPVAPTKYGGENG